MVKTLVLVRHGEPELRSESGMDADRRLTRSGRRALEAAFPRTFALLGDDPELELWSSPAIRALETAAVVADATNTNDVHVCSALYDQDVPSFLSELYACDASTVIAVGHVPFMDMLAAQLVGPCPAFGKGTVVAISLPNGPMSRGSLLWYVAGPVPVAWEPLSSVEAEVASLAQELVAKADAFMVTPDDAVILRDFRVALRSLRSVLQFLKPWQAKKQGKPADKLLRKLQGVTSRLRGLDILYQTVIDLVDSGELGDNSLLPVACAKERALEQESVVTFMRQARVEKKLGALADELATFRWKSRVAEDGLTEADFQAHFDEELDALDAQLFGLDLAKADVVAAARHDAKEMHYIAKSLACVLGQERADTSGYMDEVQGDLGELSVARRNQKLAEECSRSPRFRGVRADLGVVARDQREVVSATLSGLRRIDTELSAKDGAEEA